MQDEEQGTVEDLVRYRLKTANEELKDAKMLFDAGSCKSANNRAYYSMFHAINAVHGLDGRSFKRHKDAIGYFNKEYVKTGIFSRETVRKINNASLIRNASDYDDFYVASLSETRALIVAAEELLIEAENYCNQRLSNEKSIGGYIK